MFNILYFILHSLVFFNKPVTIWGKTTVKLLEKIEELTLYMIEMKKQNEMLIKTVEGQQKKIEVLENKLK